MGGEAAVVNRDGADSRTGCCMLLLNGPYSLLKLVVLSVPLIGTSGQRVRGVELALLYERQSHEGTRRHGFCCSYFPFPRDSRPHSHPASHTCAISTQLLNQRFSVRVSDGDGRSQGRD